MRNYLIPQAKIKEFIGGNLSAIGERWFMPQSVSTEIFLILTTPHHFMRFLKESQIILA